MSLKPLASPAFKFSLLAASGATAAAYFLYPSPSRSAPTSSTSQISPSHFSPATLSATEISSPDTKLLTLTVPLHLIPKPAPFTPIWSVFIKDDDIQVERPYTPLQGIDEHGRMLFWIKKYPRGEVGRWLHSKLIGETIEFRGPLPTWNWEPDKWDHIVMISGGTGITPFYQLLHRVIPSKQCPNTKFTLLHSSHSEQDLPPSIILKTLMSYKDTERFNLRVFVNSNTIQQGVETGRIDERVIRETLGYKESSSWWPFNSSEKPIMDSRTLFLVCGPEPMIAAIAGPYGRNFSQGPVGGALGKIGYPSVQVRKL